MCRPLVLSVVAVSVAMLQSGCVNRSDERMIDAAQSLVPPGSEVTETLENTGLRILVGSYSVHLTISDGGLGDDLVDAIEQQASAGGWASTYHRDAPGGVELGFVRNGFQADVDVRTKKEIVNAAITVSEDES
jgi:hypothetical protein